MSKDDLIERFKAEFAGLPALPPIRLELDRVTAWAVLSSLQLALRHPHNTGPVRAMAEGIARIIQGEIAADGALAIIAERGWDPKFDADA